jgi:hypothetical protein
MPSLIEIDGAADLPRHLELRRGDVVLLWATGARLQAGKRDVIQALGPFTPAIATLDGVVVAPAAPPNTVLLVAHTPGEVSIDVVTGDAWGTRRESRLRIVVSE